MKEGGNTNSLSFRLKCKMSPDISVFDKSYKKNKKIINTLELINQELIRPSRILHFNPVLKRRMSSVS